MRVTATLLLTALAATALPTAENAVPLAARDVSASQWAELGCVSDATPRLLEQQVYVGNLNSRDYCVNTCASRGFKYASVEYSKECWCGNTIITSGGAGKVLPQSKCQNNCAANPGQKCGGAWTGNLFANPAALVSDGCYRDSSNRVLPGAVLKGSNMSPQVCVSFCAQGGYAYAGVEYGRECYCGSNKPTNKVADSQCSMTCEGDRSKLCGASYLLNLYSLGGASGGGGSTNPGTTTTSTSPTTTTTTAQPPASTGPILINSNAPNKAISGTQNGPGSGSTKYVWAHFMVGNTYTYNQDMWRQQISAAKSAGIDGFALNMGPEGWITDRAADAYTVAASMGFKLFLSLDMAVQSCASANDATTVANLVKRFASSSAQAKYNNRILVSTFAGDNCQFGQGSTQNGWNYVRNLLTQGGVNMYFIPATFADPNSFTNANWLDGAFAWNSAWPMGNYDINTNTDNSYMNGLAGKSYMAGISPFFFTYYGPNTYNKNWIYRSDNWMLATRFEQLISTRNKFDHVELITWNDFGESSYVGSLAVASDQPMSTGWTNGMPHTALQSLIKLYADVFRSGNFPSSYGDKLWLWTRPHPKNAKPTNPTNARPDHADWTDDNLYVVVTLSAPSTVKIESGGNQATWNLPAGLSKLSVGSAAGTIKASITRNGNTVKSYDSNGQFSYTTTPRDYNFNYFVAEV